MLVREVWVDRREAVLKIETGAVTGQALQLGQRNGEKSTLTADFPPIVSNSLGRHWDLRSESEWGAGRTDGPNERTLLQTEE